MQIPITNRRVHFISIVDRSLLTGAMTDYHLFLHHDKLKILMWAWSGGLQNTAPSPAGASHIRQSFSREKRQQTCVKGVS